MTDQTPAKRTPNLDALLNDFRAQAEELGLGDEARAACEAYLLEKTKQAWIRGKEFGWKKAWAWKRKGEQAPAAAQ